MIWKLLIASFFIGSACAMHLEYLKVDSAEEILDGTLDKDLMMPEAQLPGLCWACKWAMKKVRRHLGNNASMDTIKKELASVCDPIGFLRGICKSIITKYMDTLVEELSTSDNANTICSNIGICSYSSAYMLELIRAFPQKNQKI